MQVLPLQVVVDDSGTPTNVDFGVGGQINYGARFNGSSSYVNLGTGSSGLSGLLNQKVSQSVSFWMNTSYTGISGNSIIYSVYAGSGISLNIYYFTNGTLYFLTRYSNNSTTFTTTQTFNDSQWHHIAVTIDVDDLERKIYIDNSLVSTQTLSSASYGGSGTTGVALGTNGNFNTQYYKGDLDQVRIFNRALSTDNNGVNEIATLYAEQACVYTSTTDIVGYPASASSDIVAYYKLDNSSEDFSTGGNDGTDTDIEYRFGRFGQAAVFNGSSSYIDVSSFSFGSDNLSISMWIKPSSTQNAYANLIDFNQTNTSKVGVFAIQQDASNTNQYKVWQWNGSSYNQSNSVTLTADTWNHLVYALQSNGNYAFYFKWYKFNKRK